MSRKIFSLEVNHHSKVVVPSGFWMMRNPSLKKWWNSLPPTPPKKKILAIFLDFQGLWSIQPTSSGTSKKIHEFDRKCAWKPRDSSLGGHVDTPQLPPFVMDQIVMDGTFGIHQLCIQNFPMAKNRCDLFLKWCSQSHGPAWLKDPCIEFIELEAFFLRGLEPGAVQKMAEARHDDARLTFSQKGGR